MVAARVLVGLVVAGLVVAEAKLAYRSFTQLDLGRSPQQLLLRQAPRLAGRRVLAETCPFPEDFLARVAGATCVPMGDADAAAAAVAPGDYVLARTPTTAGQLTVVDRNAAARLVPARTRERDGGTRPSDSRRRRSRPRRAVVEPRHARHPPPLPGQRPGVAGLRDVRRPAAARANGGRSAPRASLRPARPTSSTSDPATDGRGCWRRAIPTAGLNGRSPTPTTTGPAPASARGSPPATATARSWTSTTAAGGTPTTTTARRAAAGPTTCGCCAGSSSTASACPTIGATTSDGSGPRSSGLRRAGPGSRASWAAESTSRTPMPPVAIITRDEATRRVRMTRPCRVS